MAVHDRDAGKPPVVVLSFAGTGLATVRCLASGGMKIYAALFPLTGSGLELRWSRRCEVIALPFLPEDEDALLRWLRGLARSLGQRPVVFPTSDATALFLAKHRSRLGDVAITWETSYEELHRIIHKNELYRAAEAIGVRVPSMSIAPDEAELAAWCQTNPPPYFVKPFYASMPDCAMKRKNQVFRSEAEVLAHARAEGLQNLIVQRAIDSGDGHVFDAYGLCNRHGRVLELASHRRIRQYPPGTGATSYGEIPILDDPGVERDIFRETRRLLSSLRYHGIFGIEWLREKGTGALYLVDFNARPFSSIGHLAFSGLNLPLLAYHDLLGSQGPPASSQKWLRPCRWVDLNRDLPSFRESGRDRGQTWIGFARSVARCRSFAYFDLADPGPWLCRSADLVRMVALHLAKRGRKAAHALFPAAPVVEQYTTRL